MEDQKLMDYFKFDEDDLQANQTLISRRNRKRNYLPIRAVPSSEDSGRTVADGVKFGIDSLTKDARLQNGRTSEESLACVARFPVGTNGPDRGFPEPALSWPSEACIFGPRAERSLPIPLERIVLPRPSHPRAGAFSPSSFIAICKSAQASFFCRGSRSRNAG